MEFLPALVVVVFSGSIFCILLYLVINRIATKKTEDFEKRDY